MSLIVPCVWNCDGDTEDLVYELVVKTFELMDVIPEKTVYVNVEFEPAEEMDGALGWCFDQDLEGSGEIQILVSDALLQDRHELRRTIVHETIHATQLVRGIPMCEEEAYEYEDKV